MKEGGQFKVKTSEIQRYEFEDVSMTDSFVKSTHVQYIYFNVCITLGHMVQMSQGMYVYACI